MRWAALAALLAACGGAGRKETTPVAPQVFSPAQIAERALPSVVLIQTPVMLGTGFVVWKDGRIATNLHVLAGATEAKVILHDKREFTQIEVLGVDPTHDLAVIRIRGVEGLEPLPLGDSDTVKPGERVVAIGHPLGLGNTISDGIISAVRPLDPKVTLLQITAPIAQGSSGGPIFNERGEVIAVATLYASEGQNLNFGMPVAYLKPLLLGEQPISLQAFQRQVDLSILEGCEVEDVKLAVTEITDALSIGVPKFNSGDHQGCADAYEKAALKVIGALKGCRGVRETLLGGVSAANRAGTATQKAWALRHSFDRVMNAFDAAVKQVEERKK